MLIKRRRPGVTRRTVASVGAAVLAVSGGAIALAPQASQASSHREAPLIAGDPRADNTDVYAFVSPDKPDTVTLIANFVPLQNPAGGPNFYEFGDDVLYEIHVSNKGDARADVTYQFRFTTKVRNDSTFLYNTGPISSIDDPARNRPQSYSLTRVARGDRGRLLASRLSCPPVNIGPRSTPNYATLAGQAVHSVQGGRKVFAGQRAEGFHVDLGSIFDLGTLRPLEQILALLIGAGFAADQALHIYRAYFGLLHGHVLNELQEVLVDRHATDALLRLGLDRLPAQDFPRIRSLADALLAGYDGAAELDRGMTILLEGLRAERPAAP